MMKAHGEYQGMLPSLLDHKENELLDREGYVVIDLLQTEDLDRLRETHARFAAVHRGPFSASLLIPDAQVRADVHYAVDIVMARALSRVLAHYRTVFCGFAVKDPCVLGGEMPLHQDISFSRPEGRPGLSLWAPLCEVASHNGGLCVVPHSHRGNPHVRAAGSPSASHSPDLNAWAGRLRMLNVMPGKAVVMNQALLHASPGNRSAIARVVATAVAVPCEEPLRYYHRVAVDGHANLEVFDVPDTFYLNHRLGTRPRREDGRRVGSVAERVDVICPHASD
ncbi:phytanoyl-CoA dioxygenase family protein [Paraburkholderia sp. J12]|uniref:phytanoyl-CoA dioxygenase family protein n=1 Tax=Paraburkholderia sp. J12 TaxID=2805432 RepID=UPI002ABE430D|nr:phytanoyl-CoA dioxygenase family protein [Paraburkholderia sp. J12]